MLVMTKGVHSDPGMLSLLQQNNQHYWAIIDDEWRATQSVRILR